MASCRSKLLRNARTLLLVLMGWVATTGAAAQLDPSDSQPVTLDRKIASKLLVRQIEPEYPPVAKINFIQGRVRLQVIVSAQGKVSEVHVVRGHPFLAASALRAISRWAYRPLLRASAPTAFQTFVDVNFRLRRRKIEELPVQPERDLSERINPPEIVAKPTGGPLTASVRLRILLNDKGRVIDSLPVSGLPANFGAARKDIERWTFRPARWGALSVPWYLDVDVPVEGLPLQQSNGDPGGR